MKHKVEYLILCLFLTLAPLYGGDFVAIKWFLLPLALGAVFVKSGKAFPGLIIFAAYSTNAYPVFLAMFLFTVLHFNKLGKLKVLFLLVSSLLPFVLWHVFRRFLEGATNIGLSLNHFYVYFTLFGFFYGYLLRSKLTIVPIMVAIAVIGLGFLFQLEFIPFTAIGLLSMVLFTGILVGIFKGKIRGNIPTKIFLWTFTLAFISNLSFTIILAILYSMVFLLRPLDNSPFRITAALRGKTIYILIFASMFYAIKNANVSDYREALKVELIEVGSFEDIGNRAKGKLLGDRAPIWKSVFDYFVINPSWWFYQDAGNIKITHNDSEFHGGSHNLYLEIVRRMGFIPGLMVILFFIFFHITAGKSLSYHERLKLPFIISVSVYSLNIVGSWSGNFPLLPNYAIVGMVLLGAMVNTSSHLKSNALYESSIHHYG